MREHHKKREIPLSKPERKEDVGTGRTLVFEIKYLPGYSKRGLPCGAGTESEGKG